MERSDDATGAEERRGMVAGGGNEGLNPDFKDDETSTFRTRSPQTWSAKHQ